MKRYQLCGEKSAMVLSEEGHWVTLDEHQIEMKKLNDLVGERNRLIMEKCSMIDSLSAALLELRKENEELQILVRAYTE